MTPEKLSLVMNQQENAAPQVDRLVKLVSDKEMTLEQLEKLKGELTADFIEVASDLATFDLARGHIDRLLSHLWESGARSERDILIMGMHEFHRIARDVLGPLWSGYVHEVLDSAQNGEVLLFAARDATPMYWAARGLIESNPGAYDLGDSILVHVDWNRWFMGQEDETESGQKPLSIKDPQLKKFYEQMGFGCGKMVKIVEPGAWGSAANALRTTMPDQNFELWFMFSHMPERIYGFLNSQTTGIAPKYMEMINDTAEAMPKSYVRPTELIERDGRVVADTGGKVLESPFMQLWSWAVNAGAYEAGQRRAAGQSHNIQAQVEMIIELAQLSAEGRWTGVLPRNTLTWTEGEQWKAKWPWGKIPPLR